MDQVSLECDSSVELVRNLTSRWPGLSAEFVRIERATNLSYRLAGESNYVALHDMTMSDGETRLDEAEAVRVLDLRDRLTFLPRGCGISGWSNLSAKRHSFIALHYEPESVMRELEFLTPGSSKPFVYFNDAALWSTLRKIQHAMSAEEACHEVYLESLAIVAMLEMHRYEARSNALRVSHRGGLSLSQERLIREYIEQNLARRITLSDLAAVVHLSRFHFTRSFKKTFGAPPHQFVLACRIERAKRMLTESKLPISSVASAVGFTSSIQFSTTFRRNSGYAPLQYRRSLL